jgi:hypothetical protein
MFDEEQGNDATGPEAAKPQSGNDRDLSFTGAALRYSH